MSLCQHQIVVTLLECVCACTMPALEAVDIRGCKLIRCGLRALWVLLSRRTVIFFPWNSSLLWFAPSSGTVLAAIFGRGESQFRGGVHVAELVVCGMFVIFFPFFPFGRVQQEWPYTVGNGGGCGFCWEGEVMDGQPACLEQALSGYARATIWTGCCWEYAVTPF